MPLLSLPAELIHTVLHFAEWTDILSFISTTHYVTNCILSESDLARLRRNCRDRLLAWETDQRTQRGWPLESNPMKGAWYSHSHRYGEHMFLLHRWPNGGPGAIPCYTCLRYQSLDKFTSQMRCGGTMVGQVLAGKRICIPCGVKTGFYYGGEKVTASFAVCEKCTHLMSPWNGARNDLDTLEDMPETLPEEYDMFIQTETGNAMKINIENYWWWTYSHMCAICAAEAGYTVEQLLAAEPRKGILRRRMKERYKRGMLASLEKRQERGRKVRATLGIAEPDKLLDIESLKLHDDPFPNFKPIPILPYFDPQYLYHSDPVIRQQASPLVFHTQTAFPGSATQRADMTLQEHPL